MAVGDSRGPSGKSAGGRVRGTPNKDKTQLRVMCQEAVHTFTDLRRAEIATQWRSGWRVYGGDFLPQMLIPEETYERLLETTPSEIPPDILDMLQPEIDEYDPVVELSLAAADYRNKPELRLQANANAAQYLRPKLKSIEILDDPRSQAIMDEKNQLAMKLVAILEAAASAKRDAAK